MNDSGYREHGDLRHREQGDSRHREQGDSRHRLLKLMDYLGHTEKLCYGIFIPDSIKSKVGDRSYVVTFYRKQNKYLEKTMLPSSVDFVEVYAYRSRWQCACHGEEHYDSFRETIPFTDEMVFHTVENLEQYARVKAERDAIEKQRQKLIDDELRRVGLFLD